MKQTTRLNLARLSAASLFLAFCLELTAAELMPYNPPSASVSAPSMPGSEFYARFQEKAAKMNNSEKKTMLEDFEKRRSNAQSPDERQHYETLITILKNS